MTVQARHCRNCHGIFLPPVEQAAGSTQCPYCQQRVVIGACLPAEVAPVPEQEYHPVMEEEERERRQAFLRERSARRVAWSCAAGAGVFAALVVWQRWSAGGDDTKSRDQEITGLTEAEKAVQRDRSEIEAAVRRILGAKSMDDLLPEVAGAGHVKELMRWHFNHSPPLTPEQVVRFERVDLMDTDGFEIRRVGVTTTQRPAVWLIMSREEGNWKLNWELYSNAHFARWHAFLRESSGTTVELPLLAVKKPGADSYIVKAGADRTTHEAILLRTSDGSDISGAVVPKNSPLWKELPGIGYDDSKNSAVKLIGVITLLDPEADPPLVRLDSVVQRGWVRGTQKTVAVHSSPP